MRRAWLLGAMLLAAPAWSQETSASVRAIRVPADAIDLDGRLDEAAWALATPAAGFRQREPLEGEAATEETEVRVLYDEHALYVGILARDRQPERVLARILQRDRIMIAGGFDGRHEFSGDDAVAILLDPFLDSRNALVFASNANGAEFDALITDENPAFNSDWDAVWSVRSERLPDGWSVEFSIPFRSLRYPGGAAPRAWGFNVVRMIRRKNEETLWTGWTREAGGFNRVSRAGLLEGLDDLPRRGLNLEFKPFGLLGADQGRDEADALDTDASVDAGADFKWEMLPGLVLDATINPDFAQVEADDQQINLTRFDLFFPEKREFFLENAGIFDLGARGLAEPPPFLMFFSRRIGIGEDENEDDAEVPVLGGVRVSGRAGGQTLGFLDMVTGPAFGEGHVNYAVGRVKRDIGSAHYIGAMVTDRRSPDDANTATGVDASFWPTSSLNLQGYYARTFTSGAGGDDATWRLAADMGGDRVGFVAQHIVVGPEVNAEMGFVTREDIRRSDLFGRYTFRPRFAGLREVKVFFGGQYISNVAGQTQDWKVDPFLDIDWQSGDSLTLFASHGFVAIDEEFDLSDRVIVPIGDYDASGFGFFGRTSGNRPVSLRAFGVFDDTFDGTLENFGVAVNVAAGSHLQTRLGWSRSQADLPDGSFTGDLYSVRAGWAFSTRLVVGAFVQYNGLDDEWVTNVRLNFIHHPGSDLFVVYNEEREAGRVVDRALIMKLTWLVRF